MELIEVDPLHTEPPQAALALPSDRVRGEVGADPVGRVPRMAALREHEHVLSDPPGTERAGHDLLRMSQAVRGCGLYPRHAELHGAPDRGDRLIRSEEHTSELQ